MEEEVSATARANAWVIETLARSQQIGVSLLCELVSSIPSLAGRSGEAAREAVALRCLEELFCGSTGSVDNDPTSCTSNAVFAASDSCEDVLQRVLGENPGSDVQKDASDELKRDVHTFVELKKANLPRSTLEMVESMIVEGTLPSWKELVELAHPFSCATSIPCSGIPSSGADSASSFPSVNENCYGGETVVAEENGDSAKIGSIDQLEQASLPNGNSPRRKGGRSNYEVQGVDDTRYGMDDHEPPVKKLKFDKQSQEQPLVSCDGSGTNALEGTENHQCPNLDKQSQKPPLGSCDSSGTKALEGAENHQLPNASQKGNETPNRLILGGLRNSNVCSYNPPRTLHDNDKHTPKETDVAKKMLTFFNSPSILPDGSPVLTETEINRCMKCDKAGQLVICGDDTCPLAFHVGCLGGSVSLDYDGKFYCPLCAYKRAIAEFVRAKDKVALARKELSLFIGGEVSCQAEPDSMMAPRDDVNLGINKTTEPKNSDKAATTAANHPQLRSLKNKQPEVPAFPASAAENVFVADSENISVRAQQGAETMVQLARETIRILNPRHDHDTVGNPSHVNEKITETGQKNHNPKGAKEPTGHQAAESDEDVASSESISNADGSSETEKHKANTSVLSLTPLREVPVIKPARRKWTREEEAMLKEGVEKFFQGDNKPIPWREILQFGSSVFQKGRTPVDLKDKWRNLTRTPKIK